jgi:hypothetical protein
MEAHELRNRWLVLDVNMPSIVRPLRSVITSKFDKENVRTMAAVKQYAETHSADRAGDKHRELSSPQP